MLQPLLNQTSLPLLERVAAFGERRQEVLAGNIANIDTPEYRARDLPVREFQKALKKAVEARSTADSPHDFASTSVEGATEDLFDRDLYKPAERAHQNVVFRDGANRSIEHEAAEMTKNVMMQNYAVELMNAQYRMLMSVISERA